MTNKTQNIVIGLAAFGALGFFAYDLYNKGKLFVERLKFKVDSISIPSYSNKVVTVPMVVSITNDESLGVTASNIRVNVHLKQADGTYKSVGTVTNPGAIEIAPNYTRKIQLNPSLDFRNINPFAGKSIKDIFNDVINTGTLLSFKIDYSFMIQGQPVPPGTVYKDVSVQNLLSGLYV